LGIAFAIEFLQLADLHEYYPENYKKIFGLILGSSFSFGDLIAYTCGVVTVIFFEYRYYLYRLKDKNGYN
jgi:hypothetical protein